MNELLDLTTWELTVDEAWELLSATLNSSMEQFIPKSKPKQNQRKKIWMSKTALDLRRKKYKSWKRYTETGDYFDYIRAAKNRNELTALSRELCRKFEYDLACNLKSDQRPSCDMLTAN